MCNPFSSFWYDSSRNLHLKLHTVAFRQKPCILFQCNIFFLFFLLVNLCSTSSSTKVSKNSRSTSSQPRVAMCAACCVWKLLRSNTVWKYGDPWSVYGYVPLFRYWVFTESWCGVPPMTSINKSLWWKTYIAAIETSSFWEALAFEIHVIRQSSLWIFYLFRSLKSTTSNVCLGHIQTILQPSLWTFNVCLQQMDFSMFWTYITRLPADGVCLVYCQQKKHSSGSQVYLNNIWIDVHTS